MGNASEPRYNLNLLFGSSKRGREKREGLGVEFGTSYDYLVSWGHDIT